MIAAAKISLSRQTLIAVIAFFGMLLGTALWGTVFLFVNQGLQKDFEAKTKYFDQLHKQPTVPLDGNLAQLNAQSMMISTLSETLAASELQKAILALLDSAGGSVRSIQADPSANIAEDGLRRLSAQITFDSSLGALQEFLFALETALPYIFVDSMVVQPSSNSPAGADRLRVTLTSSSYWKPPKPADRN